MNKKELGINKNKMMQRLCHFTKEVAEYLRIGSRPIVLRDDIVKVSKDYH